MASCHPDTSFLNLIISSFPSANIKHVGCVSLLSLSSCCSIVCSAHTQKGSKVNVTVAKTSVMGTNIHLVFIHIEPKLTLIQDGRK